LSDHQYRHSCCARNAVILRGVKRSRRIHAPYGHSARSEAKSQNPRPLPSFCAERSGVAESTSLTVILRGAKRSRRIHVFMDPATSRRVTDGDAGCRMVAQGDCLGGTVGPLHPEYRHSARSETESQNPRPLPSFCAERNGVAESTSLWTLRLTRRVTLQGRYSSFFYGFPITPFGNEQAFSYVNTNWLILQRACPTSFLQTMFSGFLHGFTHICNLYIVPFFQILEPAISVRKLRIRRKKKGGDFSPPFC